MAGWIGANEEKALRQLLIIDSIRGEDSTGVAVIPRMGPVTVVKEVGDPFYLLNSKHYHNALMGFQRAIIGHNRYATSGGITVESAHPFNFDTLVGAHNGTLSNKWRLDDPDRFKVDSQNLFHHIEKNGLRAALDIIQGAWALVWWDKLTQELHFLRNKERSLYIVYSQDEKTMFWASERWMLDVVLPRNNIKIGVPFPIVEDMHYSYAIDHLGNFSKPTVKHEAAKAPTFIQHQGGTATWKKHVGTKNTFVKYQQKDNIIPLPTVSAKFISEYVGRKGVVFEIIGSLIDNNGARYLKLMDGQNPTIPLRLYLRRKDMLQHMLGREVQADINSFNTIKRDGSFFKISQLSVKLLEEKEQKSVMTFSNHRGQFLTEQAWVKAYPRCAFCSDNIQIADEGNRLTTEGECLCPSCATLDNVTQYVNLVKITKEEV